MLATSTQPRRVCYITHFREYEAEKNQPPSFPAFTNAQRKESRRVKD